MSPTRTFSTPTYGIVSETADVDLGDADWAVNDFLGTVRIRSESERPVFVGIAPETDAAAYLDGVEQHVVTDFEDEPGYSGRNGGVPENRPAEETFWAASTAGSGEQTLEWEPEDGDWTVVLMNADSTRGVSAQLSIGAELDAVFWIGAGLLIAGGLLAAGAALAITAGIRRGGH
jgi:hypothetical protein